ncbi:MAG: PRC-barrel domain-containing protein, partial [Eggerthellaceae bacterium]|nr:PRC-barrel domain-containing protein [Eggerthellaceae bacterium]
MAAVNTYSTRELSGMRVVGGGSGEARIGKLARFVFHPTQKRCVGFIVKRPDLALMFHRPDMFVPLDAFRVSDDCIVVAQGGKDATGPAAVRRLGLDWERCVMWEGMPLLTESGDDLGTVGDVVFARSSGKVVSVTAVRGAAAKARVGQTV